jgi:hypothetical protein
LKKAEKLAKNAKNKVNGDEENGGDGVAEKLYTEACPGSILVDFEAVLPLSHTVTCRMITI